MIHGKTLRITLTGVIMAFAAMAPVAQANQQELTDVHVCNQATSNSTGGPYVADGSDTGKAAKHQSGLRAMPGKGAGLTTAAARSSALSLCGLPGDKVTTPPTDEDPSDGGETITT